MFIFIHLGHYKFGFCFLWIPHGFAKENTRKGIDIFSFLGFFFPWNCIKRKTIAMNLHKGLFDNDVVFQYQYLTNWSHVRHSYFDSYDGKRNGHQTPFLRANVSFLFWINPSDENLDLQWPDSTVVMGLRKNNAKPLCLVVDSALTIKTRTEGLAHSINVLLNKI